MPELRSGARQPRSPPLVPAVAAPPATACAEPVPARRSTPRRRIGGGATEGAAPVRNRVRTRAAVAKEAAVVTTRVGNRGKGASSGRAAKQTRNNAKPTSAPKPAPVPKARPTGRGKQVSCRSHSSEPQALQDHCTPEDNVEADLDLEEARQEEGAEIREMEEESAGRSAEKLPGAEEDGSAAPLPERVFLYDALFHYYLLGSLLWLLCTLQWIGVRVVVSIAVYQI